MQGEGLTKAQEAGSGGYRKTVAVVLIVTAVCLSVIYPLLQILQGRCLDLPSYYIAGKLALNGRNPYNPVELRMTAQALGMGTLVYPYIYFPMLALIFMPLSLLDFSVVQILWFCISQAFFWLSLAVMRTIADACRPDDARSPSGSRVALILMACLSYPLVSNFVNGQVNTVILFLLSAFILQLIKGADIQAGLLLGIVGMIKPQPLILFPYLLLRRRFRAAVSALITFVAGTAATASVIGWSNFRYYLTEVLPTFNMVHTTFPPILIYAPPNQSIHGFLYRLLRSTEYSSGFVQVPSLIRPLSTMLVILVFLISAGALIRWRREDLRNKRATSPGSDPMVGWEQTKARGIFRDCAFLIVTSILLSPITWDHHLVIVTIAGAYILGRISVAELIRPAVLPMFLCWVIVMSPMRPFHPAWTVSPAAGLGISLKLFAIAGFWILFMIRFRVCSAPDPLITGDTSENEN